MISLLKILEDTTVDGPGFRTAIYAAGCLHACPGCHNPASWDMQAGHLTAIDDVLQVVLADPFADVTFTGGDPLYQAEAFGRLAKAIKLHSEKNIWCYTGFLFEELLKHADAQPLLAHIDVLVDGPFVKELRNTDLPFRGSSNQRIIDVPRSLAQHNIVLWERVR